MGFLVVETTEVESIGLAGMSEQVELGRGAVLVIDTAGRACQVGVFVDGVARVARAEEMVHGHAEALLPLVQAVVAEAGVGFPDLGAVVVTAGPGSFTGLRVGLAAAHGLGLALGCPVVAVSSLGAWAMTADGAVRVALDSRRGDAFVQDFDAKGAALGAPAILPLAEIRANNDFAVIGDLAGGVAPGLAAVFRAACNPAHRCAPVPMYLRDADAVPQGAPKCG
jgi:tRNA threonylcarbamoyladenosine biosynthesis protein TsaB